MTVPNQITITFNRNITATIDANIKLYKDGTLIKTYTSFIIVGALVSVELEPLTNGIYRVEVSEGAFLSNFNELSKAFDWTFEVGNGEYDSTQYNSEYLIN